MCCFAFHVLYKLYVLILYELVGTSYGNARCDVFLVVSTAVCNHNHIFFMASKII